MHVMFLATEQEASRSCYGYYFSPHDAAYGWASTGRQKQKARFAAGPQGEKALRPMRGWPQNPFLVRSLVGSTREVKRESQILRQT